MPAPVVVIEQPEDEFGEADWRETLAAFQPGGGDIISTERSEATLVAEIPARKRRSAARFLLGYHWADNGTPYRLHRQTPVRHPHYPWLFASSVHFSQWLPVGNPDDPDGQGRAKRLAAEPGEPLAAQGNYNRAYATVLFSQPPYQVLDDDDIWFSESDRFFDRWTQISPRLDLLSADTGRQMVFAEGPSGNPNGKPFQGEVAEFRQVSYYQAVWHAVPSSYVCDGDGVPTKLMRAIGCLNDDTWMGFARNTVRFDPPEFRRYLWPIWTDEAVGGAYMYDITLNIAVFDPPASVVSPLRRGWNLFPWARGGGSGGGPGWYTAQRSDGTYYLPEIDLDTIFDHWAKP